MIQHIAPFSFPLQPTAQATEADYAVEFWVFDTNLIGPYVAKDQDRAPWPGEELRGYRGVRGVRGFDPPHLQSHELYHHVATGPLVRRKFSGSHSCNGS